MSTLLIMRSDHGALAASVHSYLSFSIITNPSGEDNFLLVPCTNLMFLGCIPYP